MSQSSESNMSSKFATDLSPADNKETSYEVIMEELLQPLWKSMPLNR